MDPVLDALARLAADEGFANPPPHVVHEAKRRILDTFGIAMAGWDERPSIAARTLALTDAAPGASGATVFGTDARTLPESAAFANSTMMHSQDFMDTYLSPSGEACHPADTISAILATAEYSGASPARALSAVALAYEVACRLCDAAPIRTRGWDHVTHIGVASAMACGLVLGLEGAAMKAAISLAVIPNVALRQTRNGEISMWKASAPANAVRNGIHAARLAACGMEGPNEPYTGLNGFVKRVSGDLDPTTVGPPISDGFAIMRTHIKSTPTQYHTQAGIEAASILHGRLASALEADPLESVVVTTSDVCRELTADSENKWAPVTRETADHSMPYLVCVALRNGRIEPSDFRTAAYQDERVLADMARTRVEVDDEMSRRHPDELTVRVEVTQRSGARAVEQIDHPLGHASRPMTDAQVEEKFRASAGSRLSDSALDEVASAVWGLPDHDSVRALFSSLRVSGEQVVV